MPHQDHSSRKVRIIGIGSQGTIHPIHSLRVSSDWLLASVGDSDGTFFKEDIIERRYPRSADQ